MAISITSGSRALLIQTFCLAFCATTSTRAEAGEAHGVREFSTSVTLMTPPDTTSIVVELWGAGGGGGAGSDDTISEGGAGGGGGVSGAYRRAVLAVTPGRIYTLIAGAGGRGGRGRQAMRGMAVTR